ncbi:Methionine--tRNA ligase, cytoplasmic [Linum perenne]
MAANGTVTAERKQKIASALCKYFRVSPLGPEGDIGKSDVKSLYEKILKSAGKSTPSTVQDEVMKWIGFAESFPEDSKACSQALNGLNEELLTKSVILGNGFTPSEADVIVFSAIHSAVIGLPKSRSEELVHVFRWMDHIQDTEEFGELFEKIPLEKEQLYPQVQHTPSAAKVEVESNAKKTGQDGKKTEKVEAAQSSSKSETKNSKTKGQANKESTEEKKKPVPAETVVEKDKELSVSLLNIQVGLIRKAWKHPSADSLLVEEIDVGEAKVRQVVSGLAKYFSPDQLTNRRVALITNVKPGKLRDVMSEGLVLCASSEDHTAVEPLLPPEGAKIGERVSFSGIDGKPEDVLNPKKKQLDKITPNLFTDDKGVATFKGIPFMTSGGPCTSSISKGSIK